VKLLDVNVLVEAHRADAPKHAIAGPWLEDLVNGDEAFALHDAVLAGFVRIVTHPKVFAVPSPLPAALQFAEQVRRSPAASLLQPGPRHWEIFVRLCREADARGNLVPDAFLAALAIESGCEWITFDGDFARFPGLRWSRPGA
jgi:uncharacterized protein